MLPAWDRHSPFSKQSPQVTNEGSHGCGNGGQRGHGRGGVTRLTSLLLFLLSLWWHTLCQFLQKNHGQHEAMVTKCSRVQLTCGADRQIRMGEGAHTGKGAEERGRTRTRRQHCHNDAGWKGKKTQEAPTIRSAFNKSMRSMMALMPRSAFHRDSPSAAAPSLPVPDRTMRAFMGCGPPGSRALEPAPAPSPDPAPPLKGVLTPWPGS